MIEIGHDRERKAKEKAEKMIECKEKVTSHDNKISGLARSGYSKQLSELAERKARYS